MVRYPSVIEGETTTSSGTSGPLFHATANPQHPIQVTFDTYGHLWKNTEDDARAMAQIEARLLG